MDIVSQLLGITFVLGLLVALLWWLRRKGLAQFGAPRMALGKGRGRLLEVVESRMLAPGHALHLVRIADRGILIETHAGGCTPLERGPWADFREYPGVEK